MGPGSVCVYNSLFNRYRLLVITLEELTNRIAVLLMMRGAFGYYLDKYMYLNFRHQDPDLTSWVTT